MDVAERPYLGCGKWLLLLEQGTNLGTHQGEAEESGGQTPHGSRGWASARRKAMLTLKEFSMLISQPSKWKNSAIRTSWLATAW